MSGNELFLVLWRGTEGPRAGEEEGVVWRDQNTLTLAYSALGVVVCWPPAHMRIDIILIHLAHTGNNSILCNFSTNKSQNINILRLESMIRDTRLDIKHNFLIISSPRF